MYVCVNNFFQKNTVKVLYFSLSLSRSHIIDQCAHKDSLWTPISFFSTLCWKICNHQLVYLWHKKIGSQKLENPRTSIFKISKCVGSLVVGTTCSIRSNAKVVQKTIKKTLIYWSKSKYISQQEILKSEFQIIQHIKWTQARNF